MADEQNEIESLRKGLQQFNQLRHGDHYQLQSLLEHKLNKMISLIDDLPKKLNENIEEIQKKLNIDLTKFINELIATIKENSKQIDERLKNLEETIGSKLGDTIEGINTLDSHIGELLENTTNSLKESLISIEEVHKNSIGQLASVSENLSSYVEEFRSIKGKEEAKMINDMAVRHFYAGRKNIAIEQLKRAAKLDESSLEILTNLGIILSMESKNKEARDIFNHVLEKDPNIMEALSGMGLVMYNEGDIDGAIDIFKKAIEKDEGMASAYANLGFAYKEKEDIDKAILNWEKALELDPGLNDVKEVLTLYKDRRVDGTGEISV